MIFVKSKKLVSPKDAGFEYNSNINTDIEYYSKIVEANSYFGKEEFDHDCHDDLMDIMVNSRLN